MKKLSILRKTSKTVEPLCVFKAEVFSKVIRDFKRLSPKVFIQNFKLTYRCNILNTKQMRNKKIFRRGGLLTFFCTNYLKDLLLAQIMSNFENVYL